jgi:hypothetical protein
MKRVGLVGVLVAIVMGATVYAQKPTQGTVTAEFLFNPAELGLFHHGNGQPYSLFNNAARFRYFLNEGLGIRVQLGLNTGSEKEDFTENPDGTGGTGTRKASFSQIIIAPGVEKHFAGGEKLSTFAGAQIIVGLNSAKEELTNTNGVAYVNNFSRTIDGASIVGGNNYNKGTTFGVGLYSGADYYFLEKLYIGVEFGLNFTSTRNSDVTTKTTIAGVTNTNVQKGGSQGGLNTTAVGFLRFGYQF